MKENRTRRGRKGLRASMRIGILPECRAPWGCKWTLAPPQAVQTEALEWVQKQYGDGALCRNRTLVIVDRPGMLADIVIGFSRLKMGFNPLRASAAKAERPGSAKLLSVAQAARKMNVSRQTIYTWIDNGKLEPVKKATGRYALSEAQLAKPFSRRQSKESVASRRGKLSSPDE